MSSARLVCLSLVCCLAVVAAQTFQYSRGWTNGRKRASFPASGGQQQQQQRRAAEVAVKRAISVLEDAGLLLVPAAYEDDPLRTRLRLVHRRPLQEQDEVRGQDSLVAPPPPAQHAASAEPSASDVAPGGGENSAFPF